MALLKSNFKRSISIDDLIISEYLPKLGPGAFSLYCIYRQKLLDRNECQCPTLKQLATALSVTSPTIIKYNTELSSVGLIKTAKDGKKNAYEVNDLPKNDDNIKTDEIIVVSPVRMLQLELYNFLGKPKTFSFAREGGILRRLFKKYTAEDIRYTIKYIKNKQKKYPQSFSWMINNEYALVAEALEYKNKEEEKKEQLRGLAESYDNINNDINMDELEDFRKDKDTVGDTKKKSTYERLGDL